jgi:hypothetical protein
VDRPALDLVFRFLGDQSQVSDPQAALRLPLQGRSTGEPGFDPFFDGAAAEQYAF